MHTIKLVLVRHGESQWNKENKFTGWYDVDLSKNGHSEAKKAGKILNEKKIFFNYAYTSMLKRAIHTLWHILDEINQTWLPVNKSWRLNERHYGALQGLNKNDMIKKYGEQKVQEWRRGYSITPPPLNNKLYSGYDIRYSKLKNFPLSESLESTFHRVVFQWKNFILNDIKKNKNILIVAHGNSLRALIKYLSHLDQKEIFELNIPTAAPIVYEFNKKFEYIKDYYL